MRIVFQFNFCVSRAYIRIERIWLAKRGGSAMNRIFRNFQWTQFRNSWFWWRFVQMTQNHFGGYLRVTVASERNGTKWISNKSVQMQFRQSNDHCCCAQCPIHVKSIVKVLCASNANKPQNEIRQTKMKRKYCGLRVWEWKRMFLSLSPTCVREFASIFWIFDEQSELTRIPLKWNQRKTFEGIAVLLRERYKAPDNLYDERRRNDFSFLLFMPPKYVVRNVRGEWTQWENVCRRNQQ